jgi:hypothetical protein
MKERRADCITRAVMVIALLAPALMLWVNISMLEAIMSVLSGV